MFRAINGYAGFSTQFKLFRRRSFCSHTKNSNNNTNLDGRIESSVSTYNESYRQLDNLDFMTAAKILFTGPPKKRKFGIDFHLVQLFFACMPSLAVYLVAQYARYEMRKMEVELEEKKKQEEEARMKQEEEKANEMALSATEEEKVTSEPELLDVKARLGKLEETVKEIVVESKKQAAGSTSKTRQNAAEPGEAKLTSESRSSLQSDKQTNQNTTEQAPSLKLSSAAQESDASQKDQMGENQNRRPTQDAKKR